MVMKEAGKMRRRGKTEALGEGREGGRPFRHCLNRTLHSHDVEVDARADTERGFEQPEEMRP